MLAKFKKNRKKSSQSLFFWIFLGILTLIIVGLLTFANWKLIQRRGELRTQLETLKKELQVLEEKQGELQAKMSESLKEDYLEREARLKFNLKKPGEEVVVIKEEAGEGQIIESGKGLLEILESALGKLKFW